MHTSKLGEENSHTYKESDASWPDTAPEEILRLIALLIYFGQVKVIRDLVNIGALQL